MLDRSTLYEIEHAIDQVGEDFRHAPATILTEDDLKCQLFRQLYQIPQLARSQLTADDSVLGSCIHTELSWFNTNELLRIKPDISIIEPRFLSIYRNLQGGLPIPSKEFHFLGGDSAFIELKFYKGKQGIRKGSFNSIKNDIEKLNDLIIRNQGFTSDKIVKGYVVVFSRYREQQAEMEQLCAQYCDESVDLVYKTANVVPNDQRN